MKNSKNFAWPQDADGDVLRRLQSNGFDFDAPVDIDFNVDFDTWPPAEEFLEALNSQFPRVKEYGPDSNGKGYVLIVVNAPVTYELVMFMQNSVSDLAAPYGGICESWGVLH